MITYLHSGIDGLGVELVRDILKISLRTYRSRSRILEHVEQGDES